VHCPPTCLVTLLGHRSDYDARCDGGNDSRRLAPAADARSLKHSPRSQERSALSLYAKRDTERRGCILWGGKDSNLRPTDYESGWKPSVEPSRA
jgi:hypothetical protein